MNRQTLKEVLLGGLTVQCDFKVAHKGWFTECSLSPHYDTYMLSRPILKIFDNIDTAVDYFGTLAFNERNLRHFFRYLHKLEEKGEFCIEDVEYIKDAELDATYQEFLTHHLQEFSPYAKEFQNPEAIKLMESLQREDESDEDDTE